MRKFTFFSYDDKNEKKLLHGFEETEFEIECTSNDVFTTQIALMTTRLFDLGFDEIIIKEKDREPYSITINNELPNLLLDCEKTNRQLRRAHNLPKMWIAGEFAEN